MDLGAGYDITDEHGQPLGFFRKDFGASLLRSTFHLEGPGFAGTGQERNQLVALLRRFTELPLPAVHFDFADPDGAPLMSVERQATRPRPLHGDGARRPRRLPRGGGAGRRPRRPDAALSRWCSSRRPAAPSRRRRTTSPMHSDAFDIAAARAQARAAALAEPREDVAEVRDLDGDGVPCRLYRPAGAADGVVVHLHGGGFVFHDVDVHDASARRLANRCGLAVLSVDYRRPPEHRFPAAPDDVDTVLALARPRRAARTAWTGPTFVHGDSAGGNLALVAALRHPGRFARGGAGLPVPRPDRRLRVLPTAADGFDPRDAAWYWQQYAATAGRPRAPRPGAAALRPARAACRRPWS